MELNFLDQSRTSLEESPAVTQHRVDVHQGWRAGQGEVTGWQSRVVLEQQHLALTSHRLHGSRQDLTNTAKAEHKSLPKKRWFRGCLDWPVSSLQVGDTDGLEFRSRAITARWALRFTSLNQHTAGETGLGKARSDVQGQNVLILKIALLSTLLHTLTGIIIPAWGRNSFFCFVPVKHLKVVQSAMGIQAFVHHRWKTYAVEMTRTQRHTNSLHLWKHIREGAFTRVLVMWGNLGIIVVGQIKPFCSFPGRRSAQTWAVAQRQCVLVSIQLQSTLQHWTTMSSRNKANPTMLAENETWLFSFWSTFLCKPVQFTTHW